MIKLENTFTKSNKLYGDFFTNSERMARIFSFEDMLIDNKDNILLYIRFRHDILGTDIRSDCKGRPQTEDLSNKAQNIVQGRGGVSLFL